MSGTEVDVLSGDEAAVEVDPELVFTTPKKEHLSAAGEAQRTVPFQLDGEVYYLIKPRKWEDLLVALESTAARRASDADRIWAGKEFLESVLAPASLARLTARVKDDQDDFEWLDLYDLLPKIVSKLSAMDARNSSAGKPKPARARARAQS